MERLTSNNEEIKTLQAKNATYWLKVYFKLKEYENAEDQGMLVRLPIPIGDPVYILDYILACKLNYGCDDQYNFRCFDGIFCKQECKKYRIRETKFEYKMLNHIGKTVFLTKEEAKAALERMGEDDKRCM